MKKREYAKWSRSEEDAFFTALKVRRGVRRALRRAFVAVAHSRRNALRPCRLPLTPLRALAVVAGVGSRRSRAHCPQSAHQD